MTRRWHEWGLGWCMAATVALAAPVHVAQAQPTTCVRADFETVVDLASETLRELNQKNSAQFQGRLRQLKEKRAWSHEQFLKEAEPFVADDKITAYNEQTEDLLARINGSGGSVSTTAKPDCKVLGELRANMRSLVDAQTEKWMYMFAKIDAELAK
jgi:hypothetical protein